MLLSTWQSRAPLLVPAVLVLAALGLAAPGCRRAPAPEPVPAPAAAAPRVTLTAAAEPAVVAPGGTVTVAWRLAAAGGWHFYWAGRNDSGFAPRQRLVLPPGWTAGPLQWPAPVRLVSPGDILDHVYPDEVVLLQDFSAPRGVGAPGPVEVRADWQWLACRESCVPGRDSLRIVVAVDAAVAAPAPPSPALAAARARLPRPLPPGVITTTWRGATLDIRRQAGTPGGRLTFMPAVDCAELADLLRDGVGESLALRLLAKGGRVGPVRGLLLVEDPGAPPRAFTLDIPESPLDPTTSGG